MYAASPASSASAALGGIACTEAVPLFFLVSSLVTAPVPFALTARFVNVSVVVVAVVVAAVVGTGPFAFPLRGLAVEAAF